MSGHKRAGRPKSPPAHVRTETPEGGGTQGAETGLPDGASRRVTAGAPDGATTGAAGAAGAVEVSVVLAAYNRPDALRTLLHDLAAQDLPPGQLEVVVVDDGSARPVEPLLADLRLPFALQCVRQDNAGAAAARDRGVRLARGAIVIITDDDMRVGPDFVRRHLETHRAGATVVLGHIASSSKLAELPIFERFHARQLERFVRGVESGKIAVHGVHVCTGNVSFRRADYLALGGFDKDLKRSEDRELGVRLEKNGGKLRFAAQAITRHESDHTDLDVWLRRCFNYGVFDRKIAQKHPDVEMADPWRFFFLVSPVSRPLLMAAVAAPAPMQRATKWTMLAAQALDRRGLEAPAVAATTLAYGLEYFRGMRTEAKSLVRCAKDFRAYLQKRRGQGGHAAPETAFSKEATP